MITKRRWVLRPTKNLSSTDIDFLSRFEAIEVVDYVSKIQSVWRCNKTPILLDEEIHFNRITSYNVLDIPNNLIGNPQEFICWCHEHDFECGEFITGEIYDTNEERCFLCEMAYHKGFSNSTKYNQFVDKAVDCIIYESERFFVTSELGALKTGYLMIVPKEHYLSVAQFPENFFEEYNQVCKDVERILKGAFKGASVTFMEHGSGPSGKSSHKKSIVHAHTHVVTNFRLENKYQNMVQLKVCEDVTLASDVHYFSYQEGTTGDFKICMDPEVYVQRQFPRQVMAEQLGYAPGQYNWRSNDFKENVDATLFFLYKYLKGLKEGRIYNRTRCFVVGFEKRQ